jgi:RNA-directed DNA polymerase
MLLEEMSSGLGLPVPFIRGVARKASHAYKVYAIKKRDGGYRRIAHPARPLKALQRWLLHHVIEDWPVHEAAFAYVGGRNIYQNAERHSSSRYLLRMDFKSFFSSILAGDVAAFLANGVPRTEEWTAEDRRVFVQIVCRGGRLTVGAPTSPALSNALCFRLDHLCTALSEDRGVVYTRYADDLFFSTRSTNVLRTIPAAVGEILSKLDVPSHLKINASKERHSSKRGRRQVTGIVLASDGRAVLGRSRKRFIRRQVHNLDDLEPPERASLRGLIAFAMDIEPRFINSLILKYGRDRVMTAWKSNPA